jgi:hypothetical protein
MSTEQLAFTTTSLRQEVMSDDKKVLEKLDRRITGLRDVNLALVNELEAGGQVVDIGMARVEKLMHFLVELGLITDYQRLKEQEGWELHLRAQLQPIVHRLREMQAATQRKTKTANKLILPPGAKH